MRKFGTVFVPNYIKINMQGYLAKLMENPWLFLEFDKSGGGLNREGRLIERGAH